MTTFATPVQPAAQAREPAAGRTFSFLWLEVTGRCGLSCSHCYAGSGPSGTHGSMTADDWRSVITQAAALGISMVQFIGGEPTLHPDFAALLAHATGEGLAVEVYSNLTHIKDSWWDLLACPDVSLATSYYSDDPAEHDAITGRPGSHARTLASIRQAVARGIPLRAGLVEVRDGQRTEQALTELNALGVTRIRTDRLRRLGRAAGGADAGRAAELCGNCGRGIAAVLPSGDVCPCVMSRWLTAGNVRDTPLAAILAGPAMTTALSAIPARPVTSACAPDCAPASDSDICQPPAMSACGPDCAPASDSDICQPPAASACGPGACGPDCDSDTCRPQGGRPVLPVIG
jgi:MoaA/NifB/PqqE/SkfB family radical SAM enzyme